MSIVVQKYGGSSVATPEKLREVAARVIKTRDLGHSVVVVVSAMADTTDDLLTLAKKVSHSPERRELDMLLTAGERISMALLSMAIRELGGKSISFTGSQAGILTNDRHSDARIIEVRPIRVQDELERGNIVIVAGYQGMSYKREITTLGRGGSDTTAVALAAALDAKWCEICSDVDGVYTADPRVTPDAQRIPEISYEATQEMAEHGAKVLNAQAVEFAKKKGIAIYARATSGPLPGCDPTADGTVVRKDTKVPFGSVIGIASQAQVHLLRGSVADLDSFLQLLDELSVAAQDSQITSDQKGRYLVSMTLYSENLHQLSELEAALTEKFEGEIVILRDLATISVIENGGTGSQSTLRLGNKALSGESIFSVIATPQRVSWILSSDAVDRAANTLHQTLIKMV